MRLRFRPAATETDSGDVLEIAEPHLPPKAQTLLGTRRVPNTSQNDGSHNRRGDQRNLRPQLEQKRVAWRSGRSSSSDTLQAGAPRRDGSSAGVQASQFYTEQHPSLELANGHFYDPSKQPLTVTQQTSASAVRDMALRKGSPTVVEVNRNQYSPKIVDIKGHQNAPARPLKSAMKKSNPDLRRDREENERRAKKPGITSLFPHGKQSSSRNLPPAKFSNSPPVMIDADDYFEKETVHAEVRRQGPNGRFETHINNKLPSAHGTNNRGPRVKIFEPDIYDTAKTHTRRPPKGIQNWFDGFEISSDEEEQEPVELPSNPPRRSVEGLPSDFSLYGAQGRTARVLGGNGAARPTQGNLRADPERREGVRPYLHHRESESSVQTDGASSSTMPGGSKRGTDSRLAHSKLENESVLSLSSESEDEGARLTPVRDSRLVAGEALPLRTSSRPPIPPRRMPSYQSVGPDAIRKSSSTAQTSGSIPIRLTASMAAHLAPNRSTVASISDATSGQNPQSLTQWDSVSQRPKSVRTVQSALRGEMRSPPGSEAISVAPSDASHVMNVTDEEMMLLELMRMKRAAMQKTSFADGYRLAQNQERRKSSHSSAVKGRKQSANEDSIQSRGEVKTENALDDKTQKRRYSMIRKGSVDKNFKIGRFLSMDHPQEAPNISLAQMERFLVMKPSLLDAIQDDRPVSGTEIEADSMTEQETEGYDEEYTLDDDDYTVEDEEDASRATEEPPPMHRLNDFVQAQPLASPPEKSTPGSEEAEFDLDAIRAFLASSHGSPPIAGTLEFPTPPKQHDLEAKPEKQLNMVAPPMPDEKPVLPAIPDRSPNPLNNNRGGTTTHRIPRKPPPGQSAKSDARTERSDSSTTDPRLQPASRAIQTRDFTPLEVPHGRSGSDSLSTSRPSPLTPTFQPGPALDRNGVAIAGSDGASFGSDQCSPGADNPTGGTPAPVNTSRYSKRPPQIDTAGGKGLDRMPGVSRMESISSITSAGEDVLAAWAELGGGSDAFASRRRGR